MTKFSSESSDDSNMVSLQFTSEIVSSYVTRNEVDPDELPKLIKTVFQTVTELSSVDASGVGADKAVPAVAADQSVHQDYIICLEDGRQYKSLKRHLMSHYGLTPDQYRKKWGLPPDYPMVAPAYAEARSRLAKQIGLGQKR